MYFFPTLWSACRRDVNIGRINILRKNEIQREIIAKQLLGLAFR